MVQRFLFLLSFITLGDCQFLQPRKLVEKMKFMQESSNRIISREDQMLLHIDISAAVDLKIKEDFKIRVFNKENNITLCEDNLVEYLSLGQYLCNFSAQDAGLRHGSNQVELEVYSAINGKKYASQKIPDIHLFEHSVYEGYYVDFYVANKTGTYAMKTVATSVFAMIMAHTVDIGATEVLGEIDQLLSVLVKSPSLKFLRFLQSSGFHASIALMDGLRQSSGSMSITMQFLFHIFCAGLSSPAGMILAGSRSVVNTLSLWSQSMSLMLMLGFRSLAHVTTQSHHYLGHNLIGISQSILASLTSVLQVVIPSLTVTLVFLYDIFYAGLSSPAGMILSGK